MLFLSVIFGFALQANALSLSYTGAATKSALLLASTDNRPLGTGFEVIYSTNGGSYRFIVTARHVIEGKETVKVGINFNLNRLDESAGHPRVKYMDLLLKNSDGNLYEYAARGIDIALIFVGYKTDEEEARIPNDAASYAVSTVTSTKHWVAHSTLPIPQIVATSLPEEDATDVVYSGFPFGFHSDKWIVPITRKCAVASSRVDGIPNIHPENFFIDCAPFEGDSGSPVFIRVISYEPGGLEISNKLAGVMSARYNATVSNEIDSNIYNKSTKTLEMQVIPVLGSVAPAREIVPTADRLIARLSPQFAHQESPMNNRLKEPQ